MTETMRVKNNILSKVQKLYNDENYDVKTLDAVMDIITYEIGEEIIVQLKERK